MIESACYNCFKMNTTPLTNISGNNDIKLDEWNRKLAEILIPNDIILALYILAGIIGNGIVIVIYGSRMKGKKEERFFIPFLAAVDLSASSVCASFGIALNMMQAKFENTHLCKTWWFFSALTTLMSMQMLLIIAVQRYRKICKPLGHQMTLKWKKIAMGIALCISLAISGPTVYFYGSVPFPNEDGSIIGQRCSKIKLVNKTGSLIFGGTFVLIAIAVVISLIVIYIRVGYTIFKHFRNFKPSKTEFRVNTKKSGPKSGEKSSCSASETLDTVNTVSSGLDVEMVSETGISSHTKRPTENVTPPNDMKAGYISKRECVPSKTPPQDKTNKRIMYRFSIMFMLVTVVFLICYIPKVILMFSEGRNPYFWEQFTDGERAGVLFVYRMYIINNMANPIIYGFMDIQFRTELRKFLMCCKN